MDFLGIGPLELIFILLIALIIFGPNDIAKAGRTVGRFLRNVVTSEGWMAFQQATKGMRNLPNNLMRQAGLEEDELERITQMTEIKEATKDLNNKISPWTTPPSKIAAQSKVSEGEFPSDDSSPPEVQSEELTSQNT